MSSLAVVIPTFQEVTRLPVLLDLLAGQTIPPDIIVVADAASPDGTALIATQHGATVVEGGKPGAGRNRGAAAVDTDLILFLDADNEPCPDFIERALAEFEARSLDIATCHIEPIERDPLTEWACDITNLYLDVMQYVMPHAPGFCILVKRAIHEHIGGFDETLVLAADHDYAQRAAGVGKFRVLRDTAMATSMRRIEKEGILRLALKYLYAETYASTGRPIREIPFEYEFGSWEKHARALQDLDLEALRDEVLERLGFKPRD